nr:hypothetical protein GCM10020092_012670 [Actinoplanes digitatis]
MAAVVGAAGPVADGVATTAARAAPAGAENFTFSLFLLSSPVQAANFGVTVQ